MHNARSLYSILLLLPLVVVSCKDYDESIPASEPTIKVAMTFDDGSRSTRMTAAETQATNGSFIGVEAIYAIPFDVQRAIVSTDRRIDTGNAWLLNGIGKNDGTSANVYKTTTSRHKLYLPFTKIMGTASYLTYAMASEQENGKIKGMDAESFAVDAAPTPASLNFDPVPFTESATQTQLDKAAAIASYLTRIANAPGWATSTEYADVRNAFLGLHAAASTDVAATVAGLYSYFAAKDPDHDAVAAVVLDRISEKATVSGEGFAMTATLSEDISDFPSDMGLPDGAAAILWNSSENKFETTAMNYNLGMLQNDETTLLVTPMNQFVHPLPLVYRNNSLIYTSNESEKEHYADNVGWNTILSYYGTQPGVVMFRTKSVAIKDQLNYAVARLETTVQATAATLKDRNGTSFTLGTATFPITGILVGGQKSVDFEFKPKADSKTYVVYDSAMPDGLALTNAEEPTAIHTLLFECEAASTDNIFIPFAIEFQNDSGKEFYGINGDMIPNGAKFYLAGKIDMSDKIGQKAFVQDCVTKLSCTVSSLENAYNVIPDLRDTNVKIGLTILPWIVPTPSTTELF